LIAACVVIVYVALATALCVYPVATAIASTVSLVLTVMGVPVVYFVDDVVGVALIA
jgi:hypothetical protein